MRNCVYRFLNKDNEIIYVGKAKNLKNRLSGHKHLPDECYKERMRIEYIKFNSEDDMNFAERYFIMKLNPRYNTILADKDFNIISSELDGMIWREYTKEGTKNKSSIYIRYYEELWNDTSLTHTDILTLNKILSLSSNKGYYSGSNKWLADYLRISQRRLKDILDNLQKKGYIKLSTIELEFGLFRDIIEPSERLWTIKENSREEC